MAQQQHDKWASLQAERGYGFPPTRDMSELEVPTCSALRIRREANGNDYMNARMWDNFRATPPTQVSSDLLAHDTNDPRFMDMNPVNTRRSGSQFRHQLDYMPSVSLPPERNSTNPFLQRLDAEGRDARNIVREFRDAVVEDNRERDLTASRKITERQFQDRWIPPDVAKEMESLQAYELLRPKQYTDFIDRKELNGGLVASSQNLASTPL